MSIRRSYIFSLLIVLSVLILSNFSSAFITGPTIRVKLDRDSGPQMFDFHLSNSGSPFFITAEDTFGDDDCTNLGVTVGAIIQRTGSLADAAIGSCRDGEAQSIVTTMFGMGMQNRCGACSLSTSTSAYQLIGDAYRSSDGLWYVCEPTNPGEEYTDPLSTLPNPRIRCEFGEITYVTSPPCDPAVDPNCNPGGTPGTPQCGGSGYDDCQQWSNKVDCENASLDPNNVNCRWCAKPYLGQPTVNSRGGTMGGAFDGAAVPFLFPSDTNPGAQFGCFNVEWGDPFNCGGCGIDTIDPDGPNPQNAIAVSPDSRSIFTDNYCRGHYAGGTPYCNEGSDNCEPSHSPTTWQNEFNSCVNPFYTYSVVAENGGHKSIGSTGATQVAYNIDEIDASSQACMFATGSALPTTGPSTDCCGGGKPRYGEGTLCQENELCDGQTWHNAVTQDGKVFKLPPIYQNPYPVAAVDGIFTQCVDAADYDALVLARGSADDNLKGCVPGVSTGSHGSSELDYFCPANYGYAGGNTPGSENGHDFVCRNSFLVDSASKLIPGAGKFFCSAADPGGVKAQAYLFADSGKRWPFDGSVSGDAARCPGVLSGGLWHDNNYFNLISTIGCPGMVDVQVDDGAYPGLFGDADGFRSFRSGVCLPFRPIEQRSMRGYFNQLNFVPSNNTYMGSVMGKGYLCTSRPQQTRVAGQSNAVVAICCGNTSSSSSACGSDIPGSRDSSVTQQFSPGQYVNLTDANNNYRMYCRTDGSWGRDLDNDANACRLTVSGGSIAYTGRYCCSEGGDDAALFNGVTYREYYNDVNGTGACYASVFQRNNDYLRINGTQVSSVIVKNGTFQGCTPHPLINSSFMRLNASDWPNPGSVPIQSNASQLINYGATCSLTDFKSSQYLCGVDGSWVQSSTNRSSVSIIPDALMNYFRQIRPNTTLKPAECCLANQCWDPLRSQCINEQVGVNQFYNTTNGDYYRCTGGMWATVNDLKATPDSCSVGLCPQANQCLVNPNGIAAQNGNTSGNPQCINSGQYMGDALCSNGTWDSRTRIAATVLSKFVGSSDDYVISCGEANKVLLNPQNPGSINSVCVLDLRPGTAGNRRLFATSLNQEIDAPSGTTVVGRDYTYALRQSFLLSYPGINLASSCLSSTDSTIPCISGTSGSQDLFRLYYDRNNNVVLFSDRPVAGLSSTWYSAICAGLPPWLSWMCPAAPQLEANLRNITFTRMYSAKVQGKEELGTLKDNMCLCRGCARQDEYVFNFRGFSLADVSSLVGPSALYRADIFNLTSSGVGANEVVRLQIRNPLGVDTDATWRALTFIKGR